MGTLSATYNDSKLEGITRATIGEGTITIAGEDSDGEGVNRDIDKAQEVIFDESLELTVSVQVETIYKKSLKTISGIIEVLDNNERQEVFSSLAAEEEIRKILVSPSEEEQIDLIIERANERNGIKIQDMSMEEQANILLDLRNKSSKNNYSLNDYDKELRNAIYGNLYRSGYTEGYSEKREMLKLTLKEKLISSSDVIKFSTKWNESGETEKLRFLREVSNLQQQTLGNTNEIKVKLFEADESNYGLYKGSEKTLYINTKNPSFSEDFPEVIDTLVHEGTHAYQHLFITDSNITNGEKDLEVQKKIFLSNFQEGMYEREGLFYKLNPIEIDAWDVGNDIKEHIRKQLSEIKEKSK